LASFDFSFLRENSSSAGAKNPVRSSRSAQAIYERLPVCSVINGEKNQYSIRLIHSRLCHGSASRLLNRLLRRTVGRLSRARINHDKTTIGRL